MGKSAPKAPDYTAAAEAQGQSSRNVTEQQTWANRPDQTTPFGSTTWSNAPEYDPTTGQTLNKWTQNTTLDPGLQHALDSQINLQSGRSDLANSLFPRAQDEFGTAMDWSQFKEAGGVPQNTADSLGGAGDWYTKAGDAIYGQWSNRQEPLMQRASEQLDTRLRNQGLKPGDQAYDAAISDLRNSQNDARQQASFGATAGAGAEASRMYGMDANTANMSFGQNTQNSNLQTQQRQQQIAEQMQRRGFSLNEINAIISGQQVGMPSMPSFSNAGRADATNYMGAAQNQYGAALDAANAKNAGWGNLFGGIAQAGSSFLGNPFAFG